jgi:membrane-bound lytic murein transglycosylase D
MRIAIVAISTIGVLSSPAPALGQHGSAPSARHENVFPSPHGLRPTIEFWKNVFAVWSENEIAAHDRDDLSIVYRVVPQQKSDETAVRKANEKEQNAIKAHIRDILLDLAERNPDPRTLAGEYRDVYNAFGSGAGPERWRKAADRIRIQRGLKEPFREGLLRSGQYYDHIVAVLEEEDVPLEIAWLPMIETTFNMEARSSVGAGGIWQFMPSTGRLYMKVGRSVDQRFDPIIAARGAARLLKHNYEALGSWPLALTAYNHGLAGMKRAVRDVGSASEPLEFETIEVVTSMKLAEIASAIGVDDRLLWQFNPSLTNAVARGRRNVPAGFELRIPPELIEEAPAQLASAVAGRSGQRVRTVEGNGTRYYTVQPGDTLSLIAVRHGTTVSVLIVLNDLEDSNHIEIGQRLKISG